MQKLALELELDGNQTIIGHDGIRLWHLSYVQKRIAINEIWIVNQVSQTHATETLPAISLVETC